MLADGSETCSNHRKDPSRSPKVTKRELRSLLHTLLFERVALTSQTEVLLPYEISRKLAPKVGSLFSGMILKGEGGAIPIG